MPDALTLHCYCDDKVTVCNLAELWYEAIMVYQQFGPNGAAVSVSLVGGGVDIGYDTEGTHSTSLSLTLADPDVWSTLQLQFTVQASAFQPPNPAPAVWQMGAWIRQVYRCIDLNNSGEVVKEVEILSAPFGADCECFDLIRRVRVEAQEDVFLDENGNANAIVGGTGRLWTSSPLGSCYGCTAIMAGFGPAPKVSYIDVQASAGPLCLCADGGVPPYLYYVLSGRLPDGLTLNHSTGCIEGTARGPGSGKVEFMVIDSIGNEATTTCDFTAACVPPLAITNWLF